MDGSRKCITKVAIAGATGVLGLHILSALSASERYDLTILVRSGSTLPIPHSGTVVEVDFESDANLVSALRDHDVLVSALGKTALALQPRLIDAAVAAGVQRVIPSEFGGNLQNPKTRQFPTYRPKVLVEEQLERHRQLSGTSYTFIYTNCLLDWGLSATGKMLLDPCKRTISLYDGGDVKFSTTSMATVGTAVVSVIDHLEETANRAVYVHDIVTTQNELMQMAQEVTAGDGGKEWTSSFVDTAKLESESYTAFQESGMSLKVFYGFAVRGAFGAGFGGHFVDCDNELLGIKEMRKSRVKEIVRQAVCHK
ncbi:hypothetical protein H2200_001294 [Cladophialophora chaetospira]|uniref:NmrA-like domain-containing protein n=1 Tax=Cladophialophora chaetospira TaxID=386627 RepID=A0AA39CPG6_9EURO|nr:hypothetical protein H2200_001294 [Cladophialophora chaetospira]